MKMLSIKKIALFVVIYLTSTMAFSNLIVPSVRGYFNNIVGGPIGSAAASTSVINIVDLEFPDITSSNADFYDKSVQSYVQIGVNPDAHFCYDTTFYSIEVDLEIKYTTVSGWSCGTSGSSSTSNSTDYQTLTISFDPVNRQVYTEQARIVYQGAYNIEARVLQITLKDRDGNVISGFPYITDATHSFSTLPADLYWEVGCKTERYYNFDYTLSPTHFLVTNDLANQEIEFSWTPQPGAEYYELEYMYVNDYSATNLTTPLATTDIFTTFRNNATRVSIHDISNGYTYRIPNIFDRGYVVARIRGVGRKGASGTDGCPLDNDISGYWSFEQNPGAPFALSSMYSSDHYAYVDRHEGTGSDNKNWKLSVSYAEDAKHKEIVEYADGSSRVRQSVTKLSSTNEAIVGETMYDYQGRPTVQILPVPVASSIVKYYENFNLEESTLQKFNREHFDDDNVFASGSCIPTAPMLSNTAGASNYYSTSNPVDAIPQSFVPLAENYPYTQVVYTPDNTGRIKMQSGVGDKHILGSGHETKYFYGKPSQDELDRLFGTNVGYKSHYQKNMVVDANGQVSVSFLDMAGKTIATALAGEPPANLDPLKDPNSPTADLYVTSAETLNVNLLGDITATFPKGEDNILLNNGTVWSNTTPLLVEADQTYHFTYSAELKDYLNECLADVCFDCVYDLEINILDGCNNPVSNDFPHIIRLGGDDFDLACNESNTYPAGGGAIDFDIPLEVGNYTILKTLKLNEDALRFYTDKYVENNSCLLTVDDFYIMPDTSGCYYSCEECLEDLGTEAAFIALYPDIPTDELQRIYKSKKAACDKMCDQNENNMCLTGFKNMLRDVTPGGQYAKYDVDASLNPMIPADRLSIFHNDPLLPDYTNSSAQFAPINNAVFGMFPWRQPHFFDVNNPSSTVYSDPLNAFYFDEDGEESRIYLDQDVLGNWVPELIASPFIGTDANGTFTYPQFLRNMDDFISRFKESWAKSLVVHHPEFLFLTECLTLSQQTTTIDGLEYNTWRYDSLLLSYDITSPSTISMSEFFDGPPALYEADFRDTDPFFQLPLASAPFPGIVGFTPNSLYQDWADEYVQGIPLNIHQAAYVTNHYGVTNPLFALPVGWDAGFTNNIDYITTQADWDLLVGGHIAIKQKLFWKYIQRKLMNDYELTNVCIGNQYYDPLIMDNANLPWLPCDLGEYIQFTNKQVRFGSPDAIYNSGTFDPPPPSNEQLLAFAQQQVYEETGKCPAAIDFQTLLTSLHQDDLLIGSLVDFNTANYLMPVLRTKLEALYGTPLSPADYVGGTTGTSQMVAFFNSNLLWEITLPPGNDWNDVQFITNVDDIVATGLGSFTFTVQVQIAGSGGTVVQWVEATGTTTLQIGDCENEIPKLCAATEETKALKKIIAAVKEYGDLEDLTPVNLGAAPYAVFPNLITPELINLLGPAGSATTFEWSKTGTGIYKLNNTATGNYLEITIDGTSTPLNTSFSVFAMSGDLLTSANTTNTNEFYLTGYANPADYLLGEETDVTVTGSINLHIGSFVTPFIVSECGEPAPMDCMTPEHDNWFELRDLLITSSTRPDCEITGLPSLLPGFSIISLLPDLDYSNDGVSSDHFILTILYPGATSTQQYPGTYCKPIRQCIECDTVVIEPPIPCDYMTFSLNFAGMLPPSPLTNPYKLQFIPPTEVQNCYSGSILQYIIPTGVYDLDNVLDAWVAQINSGTNPDITASHATGSDIIILTFSDLNDPDNECACDPAGPNPYTAQYTSSYLVGESSITYATNSAPSFCCSVEPPELCDELIYTINLSNIANDSLDWSLVALSFSPSDQLSSCNPTYPTQLDLLPPFSTTPGSLSDLLDIWANEINTDPYSNVSASHSSGSNSIIITFSGLLSNTCNCNNIIQLGEINVYDEYSVGRNELPSYYNRQIKNQCCSDPLPVIDVISYRMDFTNEFIPNNIFEEGGSLEFSPSVDLAMCYPSMFTFVPATQMEVACYTLEAVLEGWEQDINSKMDSRYEAVHPDGTKYFYINLKNITSTSCECLPPDSKNSQAGTIIIKDVDGKENLNNIVSKFCGTMEPEFAVGPAFPCPEAATEWAENPMIQLGSPCDVNLTPFNIPAPTGGNPCVQSLLAAAQLNAENAYNNYLDSVKAAFRADYIAQCMNVTEDFQVEFINQQYHFTLYYYDQAGNLIKTVPPKAVTPIAGTNLSNVTTARNAGTAYLAGHDVVGQPGEALSTKYAYNTLNQPREQVTPDGGQTQFIYDALGRLALSQNAKQAGLPNHVYSYTVYDNLGRINEVGELAATLPLSQNDALVNLSAISNYITLTNITHTQITSTTYDIVYTGNPGIVQKELRNRVSFTTYRDAFADPVRSATYYSYDIHGNVKELWNENKDVPNANHQVKKMQYDYDLVSGKVNRVTYQPESQDQWIHQYSYDADNRLTRVETSRDDVFYDRDASYFYYKHGPLSRTELGQLNVQGCDYAYTIHGWLKAVNATNLDPEKDMGHDAYNGTGTGISTVHRYFAKDVHSFSLHYYNGDYNNITNNTTFIGDMSAINTTPYNLFNGNISYMQTTILNNQNAAVPYLSRYKYDQLNRITAADYDTLIQLDNNIWTDNFTMPLHANRFTYDPNGNILTQQRNGMQANPDMDDLKYNYNSGTNQLNYVEDAITSTYNDDIDNQSSNNYTYDAIGNLTSDAAEEIDVIDWTVYGKVRSVTRASGSQKDNMEFGYGPGGQRLTKKVIKHSGEITTSYYFYDASGNMMGIYQHKDHGEEAGSLYLEEQMMYGSSRIGSVKLHEKLVTPSSGTVIYTQKRGQKRYELNNHLGNVLTTISDRRKLVCSNTSFEADVINTYDYSPFGAPLHGRSLGSEKCTKYSNNKQLTPLNDVFSTSQLLGCSAGSSGWYVLTNGTRGEIVSGVLSVSKLNGSGMPNNCGTVNGTVVSGTNPRGVGKNFGVESGRTYSVKFKARNAGNAATFFFRIVNASTNSVVLTQGFSLPTAIAFTTFNYNNLFTVSATGTYRIEFFRTGNNANNGTFFIDDVLIQSDVFVVEQTVCVSTGDNYRFGFNGQEKDNEVSGEGNSYTAEFWQYDPRIGRRWNRDPVIYPDQSPYACFNNNPIWYYDPSGLEGTNPTKEAKKYQKQLRKDGIKNSSIKTWSGDDGKLHSSVDWSEDGTAHSKVFTKEPENQYEYIQNMANYSMSNNRYFMDWGKRNGITRVLFVFEAVEKNIYENTVRGLEGTPGYEVLTYNGGGKESKKKRNKVRYNFYKTNSPCTKGVSSMEEFPPAIAEEGFEDGGRMYTTCVPVQEQAIQAIIHGIMVIGMNSGEKFLVIPVGKGGGEKIRVPVTTPNPIPYLPPVTIPEKRKPIEIWVPGGYFGSWGNIKI